MKTIRAGIACSVLIALSLAASAATRSSGGYSRPSSVSRPSGSSLYNKPSTAPKVSTSSGGYSKPQPAPSAPQSSGGYTKPPQPQSKPAAVAAPAPAKAPSAHAKGNRFDQQASRSLQMQKSQASLAAFKAEQSKFKSPPKSADPKSIASNPIVNSTKTYSRTGYDDVLKRRQSRLGGWNPPVVVYQSAPSYGSWDSTFLWWAMMHDASFFHHHRNDPSINEWRKDAMRLAEQNGELKAQVAALDSKVEDLQKNGVATNEKYLPAQVAQDPVVALSNDAIAAIPIEKPSLRLATGIKGGSYSQVAALLKQKAGGVDIQLVPTSGAAENYALLQSGKVDAAIVQSDTGFVMTKQSSESAAKEKPTFHRATLYSEYVMLVVAKDSPIKSIQDLGKDNVVYVGPEGSGSALTWNGFILTDARYKEVKTMRADYASAFEKVKADKNSALLFVAGMNTPLLNEAAKSGLYRVVPVDDPDFSELTNGENETVYDVLTLPAATYTGLQTADLQTLGVDAEWTISDAWIKKVGENAFDEVNYAVIDVVGELHKKPVAHSAASSKKGGSRWWLWLLVIAAVGGGLYFLIFRMNVTGGRHY